MSRYGLTVDVGANLAGPRTNGHARSLGDMQPAKPRRAISASYDAARDGTEYSNAWANADTLDADSANNQGVRAKLVKRSRYEAGSNGYMDGILQTHANYLVGVGPSLRMQTKDQATNNEIEKHWHKWQKAALLRRKLWCLAHAKTQDGEGFGIVRSNPNIADKVKLDIVLIETEQCRTPYLAGGETGYIDGIKFDEFGNPVWYDILKTHPAAGWSAGSMLPEQVPAKFVLHWYALRRPGQHRGVPEFRSTLNVGVAARRWREATLAAADTAAEFTLFLKTAFQPNELESVSPMSTLDIQKRMMTALPAGWDPMQMKAEHPNATYEAFHKTLLNEMARPKSMPYNLAACDSSSYNYASGRLDHQTFFAAVDCERQDGNDLVLDKLFRLWWFEAVNVYGWNFDANDPPDYCWDWPKHPVADIVSEAQAQDTRLKNGSTYPSREYAGEGHDFSDDIEKMASDYGITVEEMREILASAIFNAQNQQASMEQAGAQSQREGV